MTWVALLAIVALALLAYGLFEAGWLRTRVLEVEIEGLPEGLDGLRIALAGPRRNRARSRLGRRASARSRLHHR